MGKKYIIEIGRLERLYKAFIGAHGKPEITWLSPEVDLTPYTEPDLDAIRKEAYDKAFEDAEQVAESGKKAMYQKGLNDAREGKASCQFCEYEMCSDRFDPCRICACNYTNFFKPKKQEKEEQIQVGDEVRNIQHGWTAVVSAIDRECMTLMDTNGKLGDGYDMNRFIKTGRHFPEIAEVLQKMKETNNG